MGFKFEKNTTINSFNKVQPSEFVITNAGHWNIGLQRNEEGVYEIMCDSYAWNDLPHHFPALRKPLSKAKGDNRRSVFMGLLEQAAAITTAVIEAEAQGHKITLSDPDEDGVIRARVEEVYA